MQVSTLLVLAQSGMLGPMLSAQRMLHGYQRCVFLASACSAGVLRRLAGGPAPLGDLAREWAPSEDLRDALRDWLDIGVALGDLSREGEHYGLKSGFARKLATPQADAVAAFLEEAVTLHHRLLWEGPMRIKEARRLSLADQDRTARSSPAARGSSSRSSAMRSTSSCPGTARRGCWRSAAARASTSAARRSATRG